AGAFEGNAAGAHVAADALGVAGGGRAEAAAAGAVDGDPVAGARGDVRLFGGQAALGRGAFVEDVAAALAGEAAEDAGRGVLDAVDADVELAVAEGADLLADAEAA